jgi:hypothetical protein
MKVVVGAVALPHFIATLLRFWKLRAAADRRVTVVLGVLLVFASTVGLTAMSTDAFWTKDLRDCGVDSGGFGEVPNPGTVREPFGGNSVFQRPDSNKRKLHVARPV